MPRRTVRPIKRRANTISTSLLTALNDPNDIMMGLSSGADNFVTKPYQPQSLLDRINRVFGGRDESQVDGPGQEVSAYSWIQPASRIDMLSC